MNTRTNQVARAIEVISVWMIIAGGVLLFRNAFFGAHHSGWLILTLTIAVPVLGRIVSSSFRQVGPPSEETIEQAFDKVYTQKLRSVVLSFPQGWVYKKRGVGLHTFYVEECAFQATISIELEYLGFTEINTLEGYVAYAVELAKKVKTQLLYNRITERWGMAVHEFADESPRTAGHRVTVPYHGTEYGFQLRLKNIALAPASRQLFQRFLDHISFEPPALQPHTVFNGRLDICLPEGFFIEKTSDANRILARSTIRQNCTIEIFRCPDQQVPMSSNLLYPLLKRCPRPDQAVKELPRSPVCSLRENGFGGYVFFQATDSWGWFAAIGDLPSGGRYIFCLDDKDPCQESYCGTYHYQQIAYEILVTLSERI